MVGMLKLFSVAHVAEPWYHISSSGLHTLEKGDVLAEMRWPNTVRILKVQSYKCLEQLAKHVFIQVFESATNYTHCAVSISLICTFWF
jgi:hypothetical protein